MFLQIFITRGEKHYNKLSLYIIKRFRRRRVTNREGEGEGEEGGGELF